MVQCLLFLIEVLVMAIHTFSTKEKNAEETAAVQRVRELCIKRNINFSALVVDLLVKWERENVDRSKK